MFGFLIRVQRLLKTWEWHVIREYEHHDNSNLFNSKLRGLSRFTRNMLKVLKNWKRKNWLWIEQKWKCMSEDIGYFIKSKSERSIGPFERFEKQTTEKSIGHTQSLAISTDWFNNSDWDK